MNNEKYQLIIGRHCPVRSPDFLLGAVQESLSYGANTLTFFLDSPQNSRRRSLGRLKIPEFKKVLAAHHIDINQVLVHGPYLLNLANTANQKVFDWSVEFLKKEIARMETIGLRTLVLHPGSTLQDKSNNPLLQVARGINLVLEKNSKVRIALETMSGKGSEVGKTFEELKLIIENVDLKEKVGICWDTCHLYAAGYDIKNDLSSIIKEFETKIGLDKLWAIHLNDSLFGIGSGKDRHENLGSGKIG